MVRLIWSPVSGVISPLTRELLLTSCKTHETADDTAESEEGIQWTWLKVRWIKLEYITSSVNISNRCCLTMKTTPMIPRHFTTSSSYVFSCCFEWEMPSRQKLNTFFVWKHWWPYISMIVNSYHKSCRLFLLIVFNKFIDFQHM